MHRPVALTDTPNLFELVESMSLEGSDTLSLDTSFVFDAAFDGKPLGLSATEDGGPPPPIAPSVADDAQTQIRSHELAFCQDGGDDGALSDARLKTDIEQVGTTVYGLPLYHFRYKTGPERFEGVMAQDVLEVMPDAVVTGDDGFYRVKYGRLGIRMTRT
jgi:hypothetical protein